MVLSIVTFIGDYGLCAVAASMITLSVFLAIGALANGPQGERWSERREYVRIICVRGSFVSLFSLLACMLLTFFAFHLAHPGVPM